MTVLRREDVQSRVASWDGCPYRIASSPILAIVPLIIRRLRGPSPSRVIRRSSPPRRRLVLVSSRSPVPVGAPPRGSPPARARSPPRSSGAGLWCSARRRKRRHSRCCALSAIAITRPGCPLRRRVRATPDARPMLIVPRRFHQQPADQRVAGPRDAAAPMLLAAGVLARHEAEIRHQRARRLEPPKVMQLGQDQHRGQRVDPPEAPQPADAVRDTAPSRRSRPAAHRARCSRASS